MANEMQIFKNDEFGQVRTVVIDNEPYFVGKDVAEALGYGKGKSLANAVANHVDKEDKGVTKIMTPGGAQEMTVINESGIYSLVFGSKLPTAKKFKRWVTSEVLPAIRKHGGYLTPEKVEEVLLNPDTIITLATNLKAEQEKRKAAELQIEADCSKVVFDDSVSVSHTNILISELAKVLKQNGVPNMGQNRLFQWLRDNNKKQLHPLVEWGWDEKTCFNIAIKKAMTGKVCINYFIGFPVGAVLYKVFRNCGN